MNKQEIFSVGLKLFGVLMFVKCIEVVIRFLAFTFFYAPHLLPSNELNLLSIIGLQPDPFLFVFYLFAGFSFFSKSEQFAQHFIKDSKEKNNFSKEDVLTIAIAIAGIITIVNLTAYYVTQLPRIIVAYSSIKDLLIPAASLLDLVIAIFLLLKAPQISKLLFSKIISRFWK